MVQWPPSFRSANARIISEMATIQEPATRKPILAAVNLALQLRVLAPRVSRMDAVRALLAA